MGNLHGGEKQLTSHLFTVRLWREDADDDRQEWRGRVEHVLSGERHYFRDRATLIQYLTIFTADDHETLTRREIKSQEEQR